MKVPLTVIELSLMILGFKRDSSPSQEEIGKAYRKASMLCHPDMGGSSEMFQALTEAKEIALAFVESKKVAVPAPQPSYWPRPEPRPQPQSQPRPNPGYRSRKQGTEFDF